MKLLSAVIVGAVSLALSGTASAQSSKAVVQTRTTQVLPASSLVNPGVAAWTTLLQGSLHMAQDKDLVIGVSMEAGLFTETTVKSKLGTADTSWAEALIEVQVLVDGVPAYPGTVVYARRYQQLMARFGGIIDSCTDANGDGRLDIGTECTVTDEELQLVLDTMNANHFNFLLADLAAGDHVVEVQTRIGSSSSAMAGSASANAVIGKSSLTVEEVRLVKDLNLSF